MDKIAKKIKLLVVIALQFFVPISFTTNRVIRNNVLGTIKHNQIHPSGLNEYPITLNCGGSKNIIKEANNNT
jgi:hypothetical protein